MQSTVCFRTLNIVICDELFKVYMVLYILYGILLLARYVPNVAKRST